MCQRGKADEMGTKDWERVELRIVSGNVKQKSEDLHLSICRHLPTYLRRKLRVGLLWKTMQSASKTKSPFFAPFFASKPT